MKTTSCQERITRWVILSFFIIKLLFKQYCLQEYFLQTVPHYKLFSSFWIRLVFHLPDKSITVMITTGITGEITAATPILYTPHIRCILNDHSNDNTAKSSQQRAGHCDGCISGSRHHAGHGIDQALDHRPC